MMKSAAGSGDSSEQGIVWLRSRAVAIFACRIESRFEPDRLIHAAPVPCSGVPGEGGT